MAKTRPGISMPGPTWEDFKDEVPPRERSEKITELVEEYLDQNNKEIEDLENKLEEKQDLLEELQEEKVAIERRISEVENSISTTRATLKEKKREEQQEQDKLATFKEKFRKVKELGSDDGWKKAEEIPDYWTEKLDMSKEELWEEVKE